MDVLMVTTEKSSLGHQHRPILQKNLLANSLNYKLKKHQSLCLRQQEETTRALSIETMSTFHLSDENLADVQDWPDRFNKYSAAGNNKEVLTSKPSSALFGKTETPSPLQRNEDETAFQDNVTVNGIRHAEPTYNSREFTLNDCEDAVDRVKVRKRNGVFEPLNKHAQTKQRAVHPLCRRQPSGRHYKTFILAGETIKEIKAKPNDRKIGDKGNRASDYCDQNMHRESNDFNFIDMDDEFAFRRPEYIPPRRDINSIGLTWSFPAIDHENTKQQQQTKPVWSWLVAHDNYRDKTQGLRHVRNQGLGLKGKYSKDIHPVATAMNRQGISTSKVKWTVPPCRTSTVDVTRLVMGRLELIKRPMTCLFNDQESDLQ